MFFRSKSCGFVAAVVVYSSLIAAAKAPAPAGQPAQESPTARLQPAGPNEHPLMPALRWAREGLPAIEKIQDYTATVIKRERIGSKLGEDQYMAIKVRQKPFSVYSVFVSPASERGKEVLYVEGANNGKMWAHGTGLQLKMFGTVSLDPEGNVAMTNQRYPITQIGILNLTRRLADVAAEEVKYGECEVKYFKGAKINDRVCTCIQVVHPVPRKNFLFNVARIFVDDGLNIPIRYEAYDWPKTEGGAPELIEMYTYLNLKLNVGLTDADFDRYNPAYHLSK
jgi:hypothetical protein